MAIKTTCEHCVFRVNDSDGEQNGCKFGRLETFKMRGEAVKSGDDDFFNINRFCNYCRTEKSFVSIDKLLNETKARFSILLSLDELEKQPPLSYTGCELFVTVKNGKEYNVARDIAKEVGVKYKINISDTPQHTIKKLRHHDNTYLVLGNVEDRDLIWVNKLVNTLMEKVIVYETGDVFIVMKNLFTVYCFDKKYYENKTLKEVYDDVVNKIKEENENWRDFIWSKKDHNNNSTL